MPVYVYKCALGHVTESLLFRYDTTPVRCAKCGGTATVQIGEVGWKLKGAGWPSQAMKRAQENFGPNAANEKFKVEV